MNSLTHMQRRLTSRGLEIELLLSLCLVLLLLTIMGLASAQHSFRWTAFLPALLFMALFLLVSVALALRGRGEDQLVLPLAAFLAALGMLLVQQLEPALVTRYGSLYRGVGERQGYWVLLGGLVIVLINWLPWRMYWLQHYRYSWLILGLVLVGSAALFGVERNGARLWLRLGELQIQPVEPLKILLVVFLAAYLDQHRDLIGRAYRLGWLQLPPLPYLLPLLLVWALTVGLIMLEKDLGAAVLCSAIVLAMLYLATGQARYVLAGVLAFCAASVVLYPYYGHVQDRLTAWANPWANPRGSGYQLVQAQIALTQGGFLGTGPGIGNPTSVPESHTDFIFVTLSSELGFLGALAVLLCYGLLTIQGFIIAQRATNNFQRLLAAGLTSAIAIQAFVIAAGVTNLIPLTGITLPFVSYGGSATLVHFAMIGLLMRISARTGAGSQT